ncbi:MAG TPA: DedA family protein [Thermoplasmata archaeon]|nr:DedA family protein [Thermoplasmata archaeon]
MTLSLIESLVSAATYVMATIGLPGLFALMALSVFGVSPFPAELLLPLAGFLVADGTFSFGGALVVALVGQMVGAYAGYAVGRWWRDRITGIGIGRLRLEAKYLERVDRFFDRYGELAAGLFRLVPVVRSYISYPAGTARMEPVRYGVYTLLGSIPYTVVLVWAGMVLGSNWVILASYLQFLDVPLIALIVALVVYLVLQVVGVLAPGWPPRRAHPSSPHVEALTGPPPSSPRAP